MVDLILYGEQFCACVCVLEREVRGEKKNKEKVGRYVLTFFKY